MKRKFTIILIPLFLIIISIVGSTLPVFAMSQVIIGGYADALSNSATEYNSVQGGYAWGSVARQKYQLISTSGTFSHLSIELSANPGTDTDAYTITLMVNGNPSALAIIFNAADTQAVDTDTVDVVAGDYIELRSTITSTPDNVPTARWSIVFSGAIANESIILGGGVASKVNTYYYPLSSTYNVASTTSISNVYQIFPTGGAVRNLYVRLHVSPGTDPDPDDLCFTVYKNDSPTLLTCTVVGSATTGYDNNDVINVSAGDYLYIEFKPENTPVNGPDVAYGITFVATTDGESLILGQSSDAPTNSQTEYNYLNTTAWNNIWDTTENLQGGQSPTGNMVLKNFYVKLASAPGASPNAWAFTIRGGGGSTDITVSITGAATTTGSDTTHTYTCVAYDDLAIMAVPTDAPTAGKVYWGLVCYIAAVTAPTITISVATNTENTTATLNGNVTVTGGENPVVTVYWGDDDGGQGAWDNNVSGVNITHPGTATLGVEEFYHNVTGLATGTTIYFSAKAVNSGGTGWPAASLNFLTKPAAPTGVSATENTTAYVTITWTASYGATAYHPFRDAVDLGAQSSGYQDTDGVAPLITQGNSVAGDGDSTAHIDLSLSGTSVANGTTYAYTVVASNATGDSTASAPDNGYRLANALTYQWNRSAGDSNADYSIIDGATSNTYEDTAAPVPTISKGTTTASDGTSTDYVTLSTTASTNTFGRYFTCTLVSTGASNTPTLATNNRGYIGVGSLSYQWKRSDTDSDADFNTNIGTANPYNDTGAPSNGDGRWYYVALTATGAANVDSDHNRGFRAIIDITNAPDNWDFGAVNLNTTSQTTINYFLIINTGNVPIDIDIQGSDLTN